MVLNVVDINLLSYELSMHDPSNTDDCWGFILKFYDEVDSNYVDFCECTSVPI